MINSGQFQKGHIPWSKTHKYSLESRKKMSEARKGKIPWNKGKFIPEYIKDKIRKSLLGRKLPEDVKEKIRNAMQGKNIGPENPRWKGGKKKIQSGYIMMYCPYHPYANYGYVMEQRLVMEKQLKRFLKPTEIVHHLNGIRNDNKIGNLILFKNNSEHHKFHHMQEKL